MGGENSKELLSRMADVSKGFSPAEAKSVFDLYDTKKKGSLNRDEGMKFLEHYIRAKNLKINAAELFRTLDADGDGNIQYEELVRHASSFASGEARPFWDAVIMVTVKSAKGLINRRLLGSPDPVCFVRCGIETRQTSGQKSTVNPQWNDKPLPMKPFDENDEIHFNLVSFHKGKDQLSQLGHCCVPVKSLLSMPAGHRSQELKLEIADRDDKEVSGSLDVYFQWGQPAPAPVPQSGAGLLYEPKPVFDPKKHPTICSLNIQFSAAGNVVLQLKNEDGTSRNNIDILFRDLVRVRMPGSHKLSFEATGGRQYRVYRSENPDVVALITEFRQCLQNMGFCYPRPPPFEIDVPANTFSTALTQLTFANPITADWDKIVAVFGASIYLPMIMRQFAAGNNSLVLRDYQFVHDEQALIGLFRALRYNTFFQSLTLHRDASSSAISALVGSLLQMGYWHTLSLRGLVADFGAAFHYSMFNRYTPPSLTHLDVSNNMLGNAGVGGILAGLQAVPFIRFLDLSNTGCTDVTGLRMLSGFALNVINLSNNPFLGPAVLPLVELLARTSYLQQLRVANARMDMYPLLNACARLPYLNFLDISNNNFLQCQEPLQLVVRSPALATLIASGCPFMAEILSSATFRLPSRLVVSIANGPPPPTAFLVNPMPITVRELNLSHLGLGRAGVAYVAACLSSYPHGIEVLNLSYNVVPLARGEVPHISIAELSQLVNAVSPLRDLDLSVSTAGPSGYGVELAPFLDSLATCRLTRLDVSGNTFEDTGLLAIGRALRKNRTLRYLRIDGARGTLMGYKALRGCLYGNQNILDISIPQKDVELQMAVQNTKLRQCVEMERTARAAVKRACKPSTRSIRAKTQALADLRIAKKGQSAANREIVKLQKLIREIDTARARNEAAYQSKQQIREEKQQPKTVKKREKEAKAIKKFEKQKMKKAKKLIEHFQELMPRFKNADKEITRDMKAVLKQKPYTEITIYQLVQCLELSQEIKNISGNLYGQMCGFVAETRVDIFIAEAQQRRVHDMTKNSNISPTTTVDKNKKYKSKYYERNRHTNVVYHDTYYRNNYYYYDPYDNYYCFDSWGYDRGYGQCGWYTSPLDVCPLQDVQAYQGPPSVDAPINPDPGNEQKDDSSNNNNDNSSNNNNDAADDNNNDLSNNSAGGGGGDDGVGGADGDGGQADIADMYAAAGPHDLPDEGPTGGGASSAVTVHIAGSGSGSREDEDEKHAEFLRKAQEKNRTLLFSLQSSWENMVRATLAKAFPTPIVISHKELYFCESSKDRSKAVVTLITQCSLDRLHCLFAQAMAWDGCLSAAIYIPSPLQDDLYALERALADVRTVHTQVEKKGTCILDIALIYQDEADTSKLYPINMLRNVALEQAKTPEVFVLDVDFIPAEGMCAQLEEHTLGDKQALIIPAFEMARTEKPVVAVVESTDDDSEVEEEEESAYKGQDRRVLLRCPTDIPRKKLEMCDLLQAKKAEPFHIKAFPQGHSNTNSERWAREIDKPYEVEYEEGYEPYVVVNKKDIPAFDERFLGYGMNKIQWLYHLNVLKFKFSVNSAHFVVAAPHVRSPSWKAAYSARPSEPFHHIQIKMLYNAFKAEMKREQA